MAKTIEKIGKVSSASVLKGTGKTWTQWVSLIERAGGRSQIHKEIAAFLRQKYKLTPWWQHAVATGFEMHIGRKGEGRNIKGEYSTMASRTFPVTTQAMWKFLESERGQEIWLKPMAPLRFAVAENFEVEGGIFGELRTLKKNERLRLRWQDEEWLKPSVVQVYLHARPKGKSILVFHQEKLPSEKMRLQMNEYWKQVLKQMQDVLK